VTSHIANITRADLLRLIDGASPEQCETIADLLGFERCEPKRVVVKEVALPFSEVSFKPPPETLTETSHTAIDTPVFWRVVGQYSRPDSDNAEKDVPDWWSAAAETPEPSSTAPPPKASSLLHWPRLLGFYRTHLITEALSQHLDEPRFVRLLAEGRHVSRVPRKRYRRWPSQLVMVIDRSEALYPLWRDYGRMRKRLQDLFGGHLKVIYAAVECGSSRGELQALLADARLTPEEAVNARWLILSDAGAAEPYSKRQEYWRTLLRDLYDLGLKQPPLALLNAPSSRWWTGLGDLVQAAFWDQEQLLQVSRGLGAIHAQPAPEIGQLLAMLSMTPEASPQLLRTLRCLLPSANQDVSWEIVAWNHPDVWHCLPECTVKDAKRQDHQERFLYDLENAAASQEWPNRALEIILNQLTGKPAFIRDQAKSWERAAKRQADPAADYLVETIKAIRIVPPDSEPDARIARKARVRWVLAVVASTDEQLIAANDKLGALRYMADRERRLQGESTVPLDPRFDFIFREQPEREYLLWQQGTGWGIVPSDADLPSTGSPLGRLRSRNRVFELASAADFWASGVAPAWASAWGEDEYGRWAEFRIEDKTGNAVTQRLRWIEPGTFQMGSPKNEAERGSDETQHQVTLTLGYWLADTVCTQALWEEVMGQNPGYFQGAERPVERVSWEEAVPFIKKLNDQIAELNLRLPTEAQWEYACRAGTQMPFWFGDNITPNQVNYNGDYPYAGGEKGEYRGETVEVKALPCNGWGLYQMHGNVLEWCSDWYGEYPEGPVKDPVGVESGERRVLRGGGWVSDGGGARSARRDGDSPVSRFIYIGFRLARGQYGAEPAGPRAARQAERRADAGRSSGAITPLPQLDYGVMVPPLMLPPQRLRVATDREDLTLEAFTQPDWAEITGRDSFGLFAEFRVQGVVQRLRWINPGEFLMGSPEQEAERLDNEIQHEVILSQGFWLADTACTQALWEAVIGQNPSYFKGAERPVEQVSWEETMEFIKKLNDQIAGLNLRLPTEAEWEYACRAGTRTPFWFGDNITTEQVNYHGEHPYAGGEKGEYRGETVEVKALPCNGWGLYQIHGNVLEWCSDWYGEYPEGPLTDPVGPKTGKRRVLRGGGWSDGGGGARSAQRNFNTPDYRNIFVGFRLARGQSSQPAGTQVARGTGQAAWSDAGPGPREAWSRLKGFFKKK
jgi:formylglycine-generating enzyme required for sulfatase activity